MFHTGTHVNSFLHSQGLIDGCSGIGVFPFYQVGALSELNAALVVGDKAGNGDGIANAKSFIFYAFALQAVAQKGSTGIAANNNSDGDVTKLGIVVVVNFGDLTGQGSFIGSGLVFAQSISVLQDLLGVGRSLHLAAGLFDLQQGTAFTKLEAALVVYKVALNGDGVTNQQGVCAITLNAVAHQGIFFEAFDFDGNRNVLVAGVVGGVDHSDLTGQGSFILGGATIGKSICFLQDGFDIGGSISNFTGNNSIQSTASLELDLALVVGDGTGNGDGIANLQSFSAFALQTVSLDGLAFYADDIHSNSDVLVAFVVGSVDLADHTGQGDFTVHGSALLQSIGFVHDGTKVQVDLGNQVLPAEGNNLAASRDGCGQGVGNILSGHFVHIDGNSAIAVLNDLDVLFSHINRPYDFVGGAVHGNGADALKVTGRFFVYVLVEGFDIFQSSVQAGGIVSRGSFLLDAASQTCTQAQAQCQNQHKCK